jgi:hypothetical protein
MPSGLIVGGADRGVVSMYDAKKIIKGENALIFSQVQSLANKLSVFLIFSSVFLSVFPHKYWELRTKTTVRTYKLLGICDNIIFYLMANKPSEFLDF